MRAGLLLSFVFFSFASLLLAPQARAAGTNGPLAGLNEKGIFYKRYVDRDVPLSIHVVRFDRSRSELGLVTTLGDGTRIGLSRLTEQLTTIPSGAGMPLAAINGDFYRTEHESFEGDPRGLQILRGELISAPIERTCFWINASGAPEIGEVTPAFTATWANGDKTPITGLNEERTGRDVILYTPAMGDSTETRGGVEFVLESADPKKWLPLRASETLHARIREIRRGGTRLKPDIMVLSMPSVSRIPGASSAAVGDTVLISTATSPSLKGVYTAIGGGPTLVRNSKAEVGRVVKGMERHPRSAVGWNKKEIFFVAVDGRQPGLSMGMNLPQLADFLVNLGCESAMNLDGGGSVELWLNGRIMNSPCFRRERYTANSLVLVEKAKDSPADTPATEAHAASGN